MEQGLLDNRIEFLATHRAVIRRQGDTVLVHSDRPQFNMAIVGKNSNLRAIPNNIDTVEIFPWSGLLTADLEAAGFSVARKLTYMVLNNDFPVWRVRDDMEIERVGTQDKMDVFSDVQNRGFNEKNQSDLALWGPWLKAANDRNLKNPNQFFYFGCLNGEAVGTVLTVFEGRTAGIYAVATLAHHRKKGISTSIMKKAVEDAFNKGVRLITLQVMTDTYVEEFYSHLGFKRAFVTTMFERKVK